MIPFLKALLGLDAQPRHPLDDQIKQAELDKLAAETAKAEAEAADLGRPLYKRYQFYVALTPVLIAVIPLLIGLLAILFANKFFIFEGKEAELKAEGVLLEAKRTLLTFEMAGLEATIATYSNTAVALTATNRLLSDILGTTAAERDTIKALLAEYSSVTNELARPNRILRRQRRTWLGFSAITWGSLQI